MFHRCKHIIRSVNGKTGFDTFLSGLHSEAHIGTPNVDEARRDFQQATAQRTFVR
ncbi:MAG: hypothetical protein ACE5Q6_02075 [Dehalococcoidia bacterium]